MKWRIVSNKYNLEGSPWRGAVGIEEDDDEVAVPGIVCWFMRGRGHEAQEVIDRHNELEQKVKL